MKLVMVHGRAQGGRDADALRKEWLDALTYGLARANATLPPGTEVAFPYYGNLLDKMVAQLDAPLTSIATPKGTNPDLQPELRGEILAGVAAGLGLTEADFDREFTGTREKGPANWEWVQAILRAIDCVPGVNAQLIDAITRDVYVYLTFPGVRGRIDAEIEASLGHEPCVLLAHSLGTIVAYNVLYRRDAAPACPALITVGSPLGVYAIQRYIENPLRSPACVGYWFNAYDDRDVVALRPLDKGTFDVAPPIENKSDVTNFTDNRHGIAGYLSDPIVARKIAAALSA